MGKCKKRILNMGTGRSKYLSPINVKRESAIEKIVFDLNKDRSYENALNTVSLFGITAEELAECGAKYEHLIALRSVLS